MMENTPIIRTPFEGRGRRGVQKATEGQKEECSENLGRTKALIAAAYEVWRIKNGIPAYDHWH